MDSFDQIPEQALAWLAAGKQVALAHVVQTWGSAPRPAGSMLAISEDAELSGSVSGGCVEAAVVSEALEAFADGAARLVEYGVTDEDAFGVGLACGGTIKILIEPVAAGQGPSRELLQDLVAARHARQPIAYLVNTATWQRRLADASDQGLDLAARFIGDKSGVDGDWFVEIHNAPLRLVVVGGVHIAQPLLRMAALMGYDCTLVDPRSAFLTPARFPGETLVDDWPDKALGDLGIDGRTGVVTLTHDPKIDDAALAIALRADGFYVGCLGSRKTHAKRVERLLKAGFSAGEVARIHAPVGADIAAKSPAEIAVSILAELTERLRRPETRR